MCAQHCLPGTKRNIAGFKSNKAAYNGRDLLFSNSMIRSTSLQHDAIGIFLFFVRFLLLLLFSIMKFIPDGVRVARRRRSPFSRPGSSLIMARFRHATVAKEDPSRHRLILPRRTTNKPRTTFRSSSPTGLPFDTTSRQTSGALHIPKGIRTQHHRKHCRIFIFSNRFLFKSDLTDLTDANSTPTRGPANNKFRVRSVLILIHRGFAIFSCVLFIRSIRKRPSFVGPNSRIAFGALTNSRVVPCPRFHYQWRWRHRLTFPPALFALSATPSAALLNNKKRDHFFETFSSTTTAPRLINPYARHVEILRTLFTTIFRFIFPTHIADKIDPRSKKSFEFYWRRAVLCFNER